MPFCKRHSRCRALIVVYSYRLAETMFEPSSLNMTLKNDSSDPTFLMPRKDGQVFTL